MVGYAAAQTGDLGQSQGHATHSGPVQSAESLDQDSRLVSVSNDLNDSGEGDDDAFDVAYLNSAIPTFEFLKKLGRGGQGTVYKAVQQSTGRVVAIKVLHDSVAGHGTRRARFKREVALVARQHHPNIAGVFDSGIAQGRPYVVMEYVEGLPIDKFVVANDSSIESIVEIMGKVIRAVGACHVRGVIHRDLKPQNVLVDLDGEPHLLDFGLAIGFDEDADPQAISQSGQIVGTLPFLSPEQALGRRDEVDTRSDIYALGLILYLLLTGKMPYPVDGDVESVRRNIAKRPPDRMVAWREGERETGRVAVGIPKDLASIVLKALSKDPARRYQSADAFAEDLARFLARDVVEARADSRWYLLKRTVRRYRRPVAVAMCFALVCLAGLIGTTLMWRRADRVARMSQLTLRMGSLTKLASSERDAKRLDQAIVFDQSVIEIGNLVTDPDVIVRRLICAAHQELAEIYRKRPDMLDCAEAESQLSLALAIQWVESDDEEDEFKRILAFCLRTQGLIYDKKGRSNEAALCQQRAAGQFAALAARNIGNDDLRFESLFSRQLMARAWLHTGRPVEALRIYAGVRAGLIDVCDRNPERFDFLIELARTESFTGECLLLTDRSGLADPEAQCWLESARRRLQEAVSSGAAAPRLIETQEILKTIETNLGVIERRRKRASTQPSDPLPASPSTGVSLPSSSGSASEAFQNR